MKQQTEETKSLEEIGTGRVTEEVPEEKRNERMKYQQIRCHKRRKLRASDSPPHIKTPNHAHTKGTPPVHLVFKTHYFSSGMSDDA